MLGCRSGFQSYVRAVSPNVTSVHCFIHRFTLCTKVLPAQLLRGAFNKFPDFFCTGIYNCRKLEIFQYVVTILLMR